jgi:hypothetical protein
VEDDSENDERKRGENRRQRDMCQSNQDQGSDYDLPMDFEMIAKDVSRDDHVVFHPIHCQSIHPKVLGQKSLPVPLHDIL